MMASKQHPASFTAFDILYVKEKSLLKTPLLKRKSILSKKCCGKSSNKYISLCGRTRESVVSIDNTETLRGYRCEKKRQFVFLWEKDKRLDKMQEHDG